MGRAARMRAGVQNASIAWAAVTFRPYFACPAAQASAWTATAPPVTPAFADRPASSGVAAADWGTARATPAARATAERIRAVEAWRLVVVTAIHVLPTCGGARAASAQAVTVVDGANVQ
ncbi:hypothetical protein Cme02nite_49950 [Catellatospora methionotrophica]|uniref:Uncharacterized protein n=1 Tax=Catellatospora methionotrophica TaxID=121620 RepID=A0A8J3LE80_9ACTN|nr:hypothetical protein Cme02nite_49950 [Catellatospora methionotrophica]